jgi:TPR repeat protein/S1-C subfamily serine protease
MKNPLLFATFCTACLFLGPVVSLAQDNAPPANLPIAPSAGPNTKAEKYRAKAESGDALAQAMLADALYYGIPSDDAFEEAAIWAEKSAAQGCPIGTALLGDMHKTGNGRPFDVEKAADLADSCRDPLLAGATTDNPVWLRWAAQVRGRFQALEFPEDPKTVPMVSTMRKAIEADDFQAPVELMRSLKYSNDSDNPDRQWIVGQLKKAAEKGSPAAMHELGMALHYGMHLPKDDAESTQWHEKAAAAGWAPSLVELAKLACSNPDKSALPARLKDLQERSLSPKNSAEAEKWFYEFASGKILPKDEAAAEDWLKRLDHERTALAIARLIQTLVRDGAEEEAERWFRRFEALEPGPIAYELIRDAAYCTRSDAVKAIWYERAANGGNPSAMKDLAEQFAEGYLRPKDDSAARDWYEKAAASGYPHEMWMTAKYLIKKEEFHEARDILTKAADQGHPHSCADLAELVAAGKGGPNDDALANRYFRKAAEARHFIAAVRLAERLENKKGKPVDGKEIFRWRSAVDFTLKTMDDLTKRVVAREISSLYYRMGNKKESLRWSIVRAEAGDDSAAGIISRADPALLKSLKSSASIIDSLKKSAEEGDAEAMYNLATAYEKGNGVKADPIQALRWYEAAARKGHYWALDQIGPMCLFGRGVPKNPKKAVEWLKKSAEKGSTFNMYLLGSVYASGKHVPMDGAEAVMWYEKAAIGGNANAMTDLGTMYTNGKGVPKEYVTAYTWANAAAAKATDDSTRKYAEEMRSFLEKRMTQQQIALGQRQTLDLLDRVEQERQRIITEYASGETNRKAAKPSAPAPPPGLAKSPIVIATGTAWAITADGYLLTAAHVVKNAISIHAVDSKGKSHFAMVIKSDEVDDLALLKIASDSKALPLRNKVVMGQKVATIGFPNSSLQGTEAKVTEGIINSLSGIGDDARQMQISVPVQPGNSGGPLIDMSGAAVGLVSSRLSDVATFKQSGALPQVVNYAQRISNAGKLLKGLTLPAPPPEGKSMDLPALVSSVRESVYFLRCTTEAK